MFSFFVSIYHQDVYGNSHFENPREQFQLLVEEHVKNLQEDKNIKNDSIKYEIRPKLMDIFLGGLIGFNVDYIYDKIIDGKIQTRHSKYTVEVIEENFLSSEKLTLIVDEKYIPASKQKTHLLCRQGFIPILKITKDHACVMPNTAIKLIERNWAEINLNAIQIFKDQNYDYKPVSVSSLYETTKLRDKQIDFISISIINLRNIETNYTINVLDPKGNEFQSCSKILSPSSLEPFTQNFWKWALDSCELEPLLGNYTIIFSSAPTTIKKIINVTE